jgi:hypothetical protein
MALYSFIGVAVTSATTIIYGTTIWDPVDVLTRFTNPVVLVIAMLALCIATLATNIAANVVSPANDFAHLAPRRISFRTGRLPHRHHRRPDDAVETGGRSHGLHLYLAHRLQRAARDRLAASSSPTISFGASASSTSWRSISRRVNIASPRVSAWSRWSHW